MPTKRQVLIKYGFNAKTFDALVASGVISVDVREGKRRSILVAEEALDNLIEGEHYIVCKCCGARQFQMTTKHLRSCAGLLLAEYKAQYPDGPFVSAWAARRKVKTPAQRDRQSKRLKARFKTEAGEKTRSVIASASKRMQAGPYREIAAQHLREMGADPVIRAARRTNTERRWRDGDLRDAVTTWHAENREQSLASVAHARRHIRKVSGPHRSVKAKMVERGLLGFKTEHPVAWYSIDEAMPDIRLAVEIDGCYWHGCEECGMPGTARVRRIDKSKDTYLRNRGWTVVRLPEHSIKRDLDGCVEQIKTTVQRLTGER